MATEYKVTYSGGFGGDTAGSSGLSTTQYGDALPDNAEIIGISYSIDMTAGGYSSSKVWRVNHFYIGSSSLSADYKEVSMSGTAQTIIGSMNYSQSDVSVFDGSITLYAKVNTSHSSTSYMRDVSITVTYQLSYGKSTATLSPSSLDAGSSMTVNLSNEKISSVYHKITWSFGSYSNTVSVSTGINSASYTIPLTWINAIPSSTSGTGSIVVYTYSSSDDSFIGSNSYVFTQQVPSSIIPSIGSISSSRIDNSVPSSWGIYVQNRSGVTLTANNASGSYGSTISSYKFSGSVSSTQTGNTLTISPITLSGTQTFYVSVTDSRGRSSGTVSCSISVSAYTSPTVSSAVAFRCTSTGTSNEEGTYAGVRVETSYTNQGGKNSLSISCQYQRVGDSSWTTGQNSMASGTTYVIGSGNLAINYTYHVRFQQTDIFGTVEKIVDVSTTQYTIFFRKGGTGIGLGKACERDNAVELNPNWNFYYGDVDLIAKINAAAGINVPTIIYSSSQPSGSTGAIWLKPKS